MKKIIGLIIAIVAALLIVFIVSGAIANKNEEKPILTPSDSTEEEENLPEWYDEGIDFCLEGGMMGVDGDNFDPTSEATKQEIAYALWVLEGKPAADSKVAFTDVDANSKYAPAISWAANAGFMSVPGSDIFTPEESVTREQLASVLYKYAQSKKHFIPAYGAPIDFEDKYEAGFWARDALGWCVKNDIMIGHNDGRLDPLGAALRSHVAVMLKRYCDMVSREDVACVRYSDFGAVGDGVTDDFDAIVATHAYANERGLPVFADEGATYYIGESSKCAVIRTNTTWTGATFIVDDSNLVPHQSKINILFLVDGDEYVRGFHIDSLEKGQKHLGFAPGEELLVSIENRHIKQYIRSGDNANQGSSMSDTFIVDADGNILSDIIWDFDVITSCKAKRIHKPLVIDGGTFLCKVNRHPSRAYFYRNIKIIRSNTTVQNLTMKIIDEGKSGSPYSGFITVIETAHVKLKNLTLDAYNAFSGDIGTYALQLNYCADITLDNVIQGNDIHDRTRWGIMCTNFCKDFVVKNSKINRFDTHMGITNCTIEDSVIGYHGINLIGHGDFVLRNSAVHNDILISLRADYGASWDGDVYIENVDWYHSSSCPSVIYARNTGTHNYGYTCYQPHNVYIDGLHVIENDDVPEKYNGLRLLSYYSLAENDGASYPYVLCERVVAKNVWSESGIPGCLSFNADHYPDVIWEIVDSNIVREFLPRP